MKKIILPFIILFSFTVHGTNYIVSGAGTTAVNGTCVENGTMNGKPKYEYDNSGTMYYLFYFSDVIFGKGWVINNSLFTPTIQWTIYYIFSTNNTPPLEGWSVGYVGIAPAPTLQLPGPVTHIVTSNSNSGAGTLRQAITDASDGDSIVFNLTAGNETIVISSELSITKTLAINGNNSLSSGTDVTVQASASSRVFNVTINQTDKTVSLSNLTVKGGSISGNGGGDPFQYILCHDHA